MDDMLSVASNLSDCQVGFVRYLKDVPESYKRENYRDILKYSDELYRLQPWPIFINKETKRYFTTVSCSIFDLIRSIPERIFANNLSDMSKYYSIPQNEIEHCVSGVTSDHLARVLGRGDFMYTVNGLKCLEFNVSANLGGWQTVFWEKAYINNSIISDYINKNCVNVLPSHLLSFLFEHVITDVMHNGTVHSDTINVAICDYEYHRAVLNRYRMFEGYFNNIYGNILKSKDSSLKGSVRFCSYQELKQQNGFIFYDGRVDSIIELNHGFIPQEIYHSFVEGKTILYNGPVSSLLSNKANLAILSENQDRSFFTNEEADIVRKTIPWTRRLIDSETNYRGESTKMIDLLSNSKNIFVLKPTNESMGTGIVIGRYANDHQWSDAIKKALATNNYIVQEYIESVPYLFQSGEDSVAEHDVAYGFFIFSSKYAGGWLRVKPRSGSNGIINAHQGAEAASIIEIDE